ncbi:DUF928 domain-containing protein [Leptothoe spongobia]|uniref:DUF928 domain-containing protein n=1 Tax=Leptothoe spongobia TAU-MAC 1115 TaxID=1967444 RepID=A0A947DBT5_9CYAN|nr:DUF928 domain-containing protein [Leptothoe spongobia]MBT9314043.1 DUF928 domain-containing protein [Leptothoe spongobia TAU-MAC 1115]
MKYIKNFEHISRRRSSKRSLIFKRCYQLVLGTVLLTLPLNPVQAQQYIPPTGDPPQTATGSNGSRGNCQGDHGVPLTGLAPALTNHVGQTATTTPTFAWFVPTTQPYRIQLSLYTIDQADLLYEVVYVGSTSEMISSLTIPEEVILESDQRYLWEINLSCDLDSPTYPEFFITEVDIVSPSADLKNALALAQTPLEQVALYAEAGYWYDALNAALGDPEGSSFVQSLLSDLAADETGLQRQYLSKIAEIMGQGDR